ncbi:MAG: phosphopentomutase [Oscillospiraceae bacterium]|nr:phosphopentomutase [Oscillospiraceae bacterium]
MNSIDRVFLIVLDSAGVGSLPDAAAFNDTGACTIGSCYKTGKLSLENMKSMGLYNIDSVDFGEPAANPGGAYGKLIEMSKGKDTTTGHLEIAGLISEKPFPVFSNGFPDEIINKFEKMTGRKVLCNKPYSGTKVIHDYGVRHMQTGGLIVYTSADSVFQIAAHEDIVNREQLYDYCRMARKLLSGKYAVARVIARPFKGVYPDFERTSGRHDFSLEPQGKTVLDALESGGYDTIGVGKIYDIFAGKGISSSVRTVSNDDGMEKTMYFADEDFNGLCFVNLVDFDMLYGHRRDSAGYTEALNRFDTWLGGFVSRLRENDIVMITADHGCDPEFQGTDHTREYIPLLVYGKKVKPVNLGVLSTYADIAATLKDIFAVDFDCPGKSFMDKIL